MRGGLVVRDLVPELARRRHVGQVGSQVGMDAAQVDLAARAVDAVLVPVADLQRDQDAGDHDHQFDDRRHPVVFTQSLGEPGRLHWNLRAMVSG